jgi:hypothetical protein
MNNIVWNMVKITKPPQVRKYYHVRDSYGSTAIAFLNTNRTWTIIGDFIGGKIDRKSITPRDITEWAIIN